MANDTVTYKAVLDTSRFSAGIKKMEKDFASAGKAAEGFGQSAKKASRSMDSMHSEALRMNAAFDKGRGSTLKLGQGFRMLSPAITTTAMAFGVNNKAVMGFNAVASIADVNFKQLRKSVVGFNTATLAGVGAAGALGYAIGTLLREIPAVAKAADSAAEAMYRWMFGMHDTAGVVGKQWQQNMAMVHAAAREKQLASQIAGGATTEQLKQTFGFSTKKDPLLAQIEAIEEKQRKQKQAAEEWARAQEAATKRVLAAFREWGKVLDEIEADFRSMSITAFGTPSTVARGPMAMFGTGKLPGEGSLAGMDNALPPGITRQQMDIALGRQAQLDAGASKEASNKIRSAALDSATQSGVDFSKMLGDVAHAFQLLGVGSDSTLGKLLGSLGLAAAAFDQIRAAGGFGNMSASGKIGVGIAGLGVAGAAYKGGSALGGMASGAAFGAAFGPWGAAIGGAVGGILGFLGRGKKKAEEAAKKAEEQKKREAQIQQAAKEMRTQSIDALAGGAASNFFLGRTILTEEDAKRSGTLFMDAWTQVVKEKGVLAAADAFGSAFDKMKADIEAQGIAMPEWMQVISGQMGLSKNEGFRAAATGSQNAAAFLGALGGAGGLSPESFRAFEQEARAQFNAASGAAKEAGMETAEATKAGFSATNPLLKELVNQSVITGQKLSADIQAMVDAQGIVPDVDIQQLSELQQIRAAVQAMAGQGGGRVVGPAAGDFDRGDFGGEDRIPGFASGGAVTRTGLALVHQGERVISRDDVKSGGDTYNVTVQASGNKQTDELLVARLMDTMGQLVRKGKGRRLTSAMADSGFAVRGRK